MQLKLPLFPKETKLFNSSFGLFSNGGTVFYLHCGQPVGMHDEEDHNSFRHKIASFIELGLCTQSEVVSTLHVSPDSIRRCCKQYRQDGEAAFFAPDKRKGIQSNIDQSINETKKWLQKQTDLKEKIEALQVEINQKAEALSKIPSKIKLADMPEEKRYNRLKKESKMFMNIIKMIAYRAETVLVNLIRPFYNNHENDKRQIIQTMLASSANLEPDYENNILKVTILCQSTPRANKALKHLCDELNQTEICYPQTNLRLMFIAPVV